MNTSVENQSDCMKHCEDKFARCSNRLPSGCVEELKQCRENCRIQHDS